MIRLDAPVAALLERLERFGADHDAHTSERARRMLNLERPTAELLLCYRRVRAKARAGNRHIERLFDDLARPRYAGHARRSGHLDRTRRRETDARAQAGLNGAVQLLEGDATAACRALPGPFD
ncbi:hypothetical protein BHUM_03864c [Candidatus Burkholderia humilis]|nr:hypothetical protein BHUM_03864c [Candidatus Burkholderia humilis]